VNKSKSRATMMPSSNMKVGQIQPPDPNAPKPKTKPRNLDDSFWKEHREGAAATMAEVAKQGATPPVVLALTLRFLGNAKPHETEYVRMSNASLRDEHLGPLIEVLHRSDCGVHHLDLAFNHLTDAGVRMLGNALCAKAVDTDFNFCAFELSHLYLGGNDGVTAECVAALRKQLAAAGRDVEVDVAAVLRDPCPLCTVGQILEPADKSPAGLAGLRAGDEVVAFGPLRTLKEPKKGFTSREQRQLEAVTYYLDVGRSVAPLVKASNGKPIDVVVRRMVPVPAAPAPAPAAAPAAAEAAEAADADTAAPAAAALAAVSLEAAAVPPASTETQEAYVRLTFVPQGWEGQGLLGCRLKAVPEPQ